MLTGRIFCGECGGSYTGVRNFSGRNNLKYVCYQCSNRKRTNGVGCTNKEILRKYVEDFIFKEVAKIIFDDSNIEALVEDYYKYHSTFDTETTDAINNHKHRLDSVEKKISNIINAVAQSGSTALLESLEGFEKERDEIREAIAKSEEQLNRCEVDRTMIELAYAYAKGMHMTGGMEGRRQLISLYLDKVVVYKEHIEFFLNTLPVSILKQGILRATEETDGGDNLLKFMIKSEPDFIKNMIHLNRRRMIFKENYEASDTDASGYIECRQNNEKKADNQPETGKLSTFIGGGEESRTPVRKPIPANFYGCSLSFKIPLFYRR